MFAVKAGKETAKTAPSSTGRLPSAHTALARNLARNKDQPVANTAHYTAPTSRPLWDFGQIPLRPVTGPRSSHPAPITPLADRLQAKFIVGQANDPFEREADHLADQVLSMADRDSPAAGSAAPQSGVSRHPSAAVVRQKCACQGSWAPCDACKNNHGVVQRTAYCPGPAYAPPAVDRVSTSTGRPLDSATKSFMEPRFGLDFSGVRVHTDTAAEQSARDLRAHAYTVGNHIIFGQGRYAPGTYEGRRLLAHELSHVAQQSGARRSRLMPVAQVVTRSARPMVQRADKMGTQVTHPKGVKSRFKTVTATFDGATFVAKGDGVVILSSPAQSGRPYTVSAADARACKGSPNDSYMNNPRYVGIKDNGPIPEGEYRFFATEMTTFSLAEQAQMLLGGNYVDPRGVSLHGGDWGAGRVGLSPVRVLPSKFCGNSAARSGFFLHGGIMPGSSGCIDVGDETFSKLVESLVGYTGRIVVTVRYTQAPPDVGPLERAAGRFMYPGRGQIKEPSILDRLKGLLGGDED
jgi:Domain of unknown function (DUF4157)/Protein of unknown function (DUF2778)